MRNSNREPHRGLRLLSLDGGGIRGISILLILESVLKHVRQRENEERRRRGQPPLEGLPKPCEIFDLIGGTNTGGIIALMLGRLEMSISEAIAAFTIITKEVYNPRITHMGYRSSVLVAEVMELVGQRTGHQGSWLISVDQRCPVFVCTRNKRNMNAGIPSLFRTYRSVEPGPEDATIWQAACATSSTPHFFDPIVVGRDQSYIDGGLGCNNPTKHVLAEAAKLYPGRSCASILSIGAGHPTTISLARSSDPEILQQMARDCEATHNETNGFLRRHPGLYTRLNVEQGMQGLNEAKNDETAETEAHTNTYLSTRGTQRILYELASELVGARGKVPIDHLEASPAPQPVNHAAPPAPPAPQAEDSMVQAARAYAAIRAQGRRAALDII